MALLSYFATHSIGLYPDTGADSCIAEETTRADSFGSPDD